MSGVTPVYGAERVTSAYPVLHAGYFEDTFRGYPPNTTNAWGDWYALLAGGGSAGAVGPANGTYTVTPSGLYYYNGANGGGYDQTRMTLRGTETWRDCWVEAALVVLSAPAQLDNAAGVGLRNNTDGNGGISWRVQYLSGAASLAPGAWQLEDQDISRWGDGPLVGPQGFGVPVVLRCTAVGDQVLCDVNGARVFHYTQTSFSEGPISIMGGAGWHVKFLWVRGGQL